MKMTSLDLKGPKDTSWPSQSSQYWDAAQRSSPRESLALGFQLSCPAFASRLRCICEERRCIFFHVTLYLHWSAQMQFIRCPHLCRRPCSAPRQRLGFHINRQAPSPGQIRRLKEPHIRNSHSLQRPASEDFSFRGIWKKGLRIRMRKMTSKKRKHT